MTQTLKVETYSNPEHLNEPDGDPPPGCRWEAGERDVEIDEGRVKAVVVWEAVEDPNRIPESREPIDLSSPSAGGAYDPEQPLENDGTVYDLKMIVSGIADAAGLEPNEWTAAGLPKLIGEELDELEEMVEKRDGRIDDLEQAYEGTRSELRRALGEVTALLSDVFDVDATDATLNKALRELGDQVEILKADKNDLEGRIHGENQSLKSVLSNIFDACNQYLDDDYRFDEADEAVKQAIQNLKGQRDTAIEALTGLPEDEGEDEPDAEGPEDQSIESCIGDIPVDRYTWQPASDLAERLDTTPQIIGMTAARYDEGQDTKWPIERRQTTSGKEYRLEPGESVGAPNAVYLIGPEVPKGVVLEEVFEGETEAKKGAASYKTDKDPDDYKPPVVRAERDDVPLGETLTWDAIEADEGMEVVQ